MNITRNFTLDYFGYQTSSDFSISMQLTNSQYSVFIDSDNIKLFAMPKFDKSNGGLYISSGEYIVFDREYDFNVVATIDSAEYDSRYSIVLNSTNSNESTIISGEIKLINARERPSITASGFKCAPVVGNNAITTSIDQEKYNQIYFDIAGATFSDETISNYTLSACSAQDQTLFRTGVLISMASNRLSVTLSNPNYGLTPFDAFGFNSANMFAVSFMRNADVDGTTVPIMFTINFNMVTTTFSMKPIATQTAMFDELHTKVLISHHFSSSLDINERQYKIGFQGNKGYNIPTNIMTRIPDVITSGSGTRPIDLSIIAMSITKASDHYVLKMVLELKTIPNRNIRSTSYEVPMYLNVIGKNYNFTVPVVINGQSK